jgi:uncharacterized protein involved in type VI secretion and phage assembly
MSPIVPVLEAIVREQMSGNRGIELGIVSAVYTNAGGSGENNLAVDLRIRGSAVELPHVPVAVGRLGLSMVPREGDLAVVGFVSGDLDGAVVLGFLYDEQNRPPDAQPDEIVYSVPEEENDDTRRLAVLLPSGNSVVIQDAQVTISMGSTSVTIEADGDIQVQAGGDISFQASGDFSVSATGDITLTADGSMTVQGGSDVSVQGPSVTVQADADATLQGATTTIAGEVSFSAS